MLACAGPGDEEAAQEEEEEGEEEEEEEEVGTLEGTLTASTSAAQLQALKGTRCHVLDLHGCSQVRAQVAVR
ncbi:MAG: hypothetical protein VX385_05750, partial [Acidobacteriota bacterium]|nr:hypothetical protein [Acidobacteriota bacterium]